MSGRPISGQGHVPPVFTHHVVSSAGAPTEPHLQINLHFHINPQTGSISPGHPPPNGQPPDQPAGWYAPYPEAHLTPGAAAPMPAADTYGPTGNPTALSSSDSSSEPDADTYGGARELSPTSGSSDSVKEPEPISMPVPIHGYNTIPGPSATYGNVRFDVDPHIDPSAYVQRRFPPGHQQTEEQRQGNKYEKVRRSKGGHDRSALVGVLFHPIFGYPIAKREASGSYALIKKSRGKSRRRSRDANYDKFIDTRRDENDTRDALWML